MPELIYLVIPGQEDIIAFSLFAKSFIRLELMHIYLFVHLSMILSVNLFIYIIICLCLWRNAIDIIIRKKIRQFFILAKQNKKFNMILFDCQDREKKKKNSLNVGSFIRCLFLKSYSVFQWKVWKHFGDQTSPNSSLRKITWRESS